mgnify:CR=1 FL=1
MNPNELSSTDIAYIAQSVCCPYYKEDFEATRAMAEAIAAQAKPGVLSTPADYVKLYDDNFFTFKSWAELVASEKEEGELALTEDQLKQEVGRTIFQLDNGWFLERV